MQAWYKSLKDDCSRVSVPRSKPRPRYVGQDAVKVWKVSSFMTGAKSFDVRVCPSLPQELVILAHCAVYLRLDSGLRILDSGT
jgi:hypothetical protein